MKYNVYRRYNNLLENIYLFLYNRILKIGYMNEVEEVKIENLIYEIRGKQVMLDSDLGRLYQCKNGTKSINLAVRRNIDRFPQDFCFQLTELEFKNLQFHFETANLKSMTRVLPYVFTEQ